MDAKKSFQVDHHNNLLQPVYVVNCIFYIFLKVYVYCYAPSHQANSRIPLNGNSLNMNGKVGWIQDYSAGCDISLQHIIDIWQTG